MGLAMFVTITLLRSCFLFYNLSRLKLWLSLSECDQSQIKSVHLPNVNK